jgi:hypothetical protein
MQTKGDEDEDQDEDNSKRRVAGYRHCVTDSWWGNAAANETP